MLESLLEMFVEVDDFCQDYQCWLRKQKLKGSGQRGPVSHLSLSEIMTIVIH